MVECQICHKLVEKLTFRDSCSRSCHMVLLSRQGRYKGTTRIADYNRSEAHRTKCRQAAVKRHLVKGARGFNSEYSDRLRNYNNILSREPSDKTRYFYIFEYETSIKIGSTSTLNRRLDALCPISTIMLLSGPSHEIAKLEFDTLVKFENDTIVDSTNSYYTEFVSKSIKDSVVEFVNSQVEGSTTIRKVEED